MSSVPSSRLKTSTGSSSRCRLTSTCSSNSVTRCSDSRSFSSFSGASAARGSQANNVAENSREGSLLASQINLRVDAARIGGDLHPQVVALLCARAAQLEIPFARLARQHVGEPGLLGNGFLVLGMEQLDRGDLDVARALVLDFQPDRVVLAQLGVPYQSRFRRSPLRLYEDRQADPQRDDEALEPGLRRRRNLLQEDAVAELALRVRGAAQADSHDLLAVRRDGHDRRTHQDLVGRRQDVLALFLRPCRDADLYHNGIGPAVPYRQCNAAVRGREVDANRVDFERACLHAKRERGQKEKQSQASAQQSAAKRSLRRFPQRRLPSKLRSYQMIGY